MKNDQGNTMLDPVRAKLRMIGVTAGAFAGGVLVASGLDWTTRSHAALLQTPGRPPASEVRPVQELSQAFITIAESVTPAVVSIETERAESRSRRRGQDGDEEGERGQGMPFPFPFPMPRGIPTCRSRPAAPAS
jgi:serine protease Do